MNWFALLLSVIKLVSVLAESARSRGLLEQGRAVEREAAMSSVLQALSKAAGIQRELRYMSDEEVTKSVESQGWFRD